MTIFCGTAPRPSTEIQTPVANQGGSFLAAPPCKQLQQACTCNQCPCQIALHTCNQSTTNVASRIQQIKSNIAALAASRLLSCVNKEDVSPYGDCLVLLVQPKERKIYLGMAAHVATQHDHMQTTNACAKYQPGFPPQGIPHHINASALSLRVCRSAPRNP